jgi:hypothetical protein
MTDMPNIAVETTQETVMLTVAGGDAVGLTVAGTTENVAISVLDSGDEANIAVTETVEAVAMQVQAIAEMVAVAIADQSETVVIEVATPTPGDAAAETFETVSKNLRAFPATLAYAAGELAAITYATPNGSVVKTLQRAAGRLTSIVLSGAVPAGIALTKTFAYSGDDLTSVGYA